MPPTKADWLVIACEYSSEYLAPGGKFAADVEMHRGAVLTLLIEGDVLTQVKQALSRL